MIPTIQPSYDHYEENSSYKVYLEKHSRAVQWLTLLLFLTLTSFLFACLFEWDRYQVIAGPRAQTMSMSDKVLLFWLLASKSIAWFLPFLVVWGILITRGRWRAAAVTLNLLWIVIFYFMAFDLVSVSFAGYHVWDYLPNIRDMLENPDLNIGQWAGERLTSEAFFVLAVFVISGPACFLVVRWITMRVVRRFRWLCSHPAPAIVTLCLILFVLGVLPALEFSRHRDWIYATMPLIPSLRKPLERFTEDLASRIGLKHNRSTSPSLLTGGHSGTDRETQRLTLYANRIRQDFDFADITIDDAAVNDAGLAWVVNLRNYDVIAPTRNIAYLKRFFPINLNVGRIGNLFGHNEDAWETQLGSDSQQEKRIAAQSGMLNHQDEPAATKLLWDALDPGPSDASAFVKKPGLPNIILIIIESFRHSAIGPGQMGKLDAWSERGLRLERHYSGSNCSHLGLFSLLYGRAPLGYHQTLDRKIPAQMLESLRRSGYQITFLTSGEVKGFRRLDQFINGRSCDNFITEGEFTLKGMNDWPDSDRRKLAHVKRIVKSSEDRPQFVFFYLVSSHYRYSFPPEFEIFKESPGIWQFLNPRAQIQNHMNRYANAVLFLEDELMKLLRSIDLNRNIIMITGDHGESMGEDGVFTHGSRMSEIQMRVPFLMVGPGVEPRKISTATVHSDILPTLLHILALKSVPIRNSHGRDLIADPAPSDEVAVVPANGPDWDGLMIIRGDKRMIFRTSAAPGKAPVMEFTGLSDESGQYEYKVSRDRHALEASQ